MTNVRKSFVRTVKQKGSDRFSMYRKGNNVHDIWVDLTAVYKNKRMQEVHSLALKYLQTIESSLIAQLKDQQIETFM